MRNSQFYMWVSGAINIKDYTDTVALAITRAQIVSCSYHDVWFRKAVAFTLHYITILELA